MTRSPLDSTYKIGQYRRRHFIFAYKVFSFKTKESEIINVSFV
nr:MAG TPA: hypothetical protein [Caudoviricetes sp.]